MGLLGRATYTIRLIFAPDQTSQEGNECATTKEKLRAYCDVRHNWRATKPSKKGYCLGFFLFTIPTTYYIQLYFHVIKIK